MFVLVDRTVSRVAWAMAVVAGIALVAIALIVMTEVTLRAMGSSLVGGIELIRITFVISVYFAFAHVIVSEREIRVDALRQLTIRRRGYLLDAFANLVTLAFFLFFLWFAAHRLVDAWSRGVYLEGRLLLPMWIPWLTIVLGSIAAVLASAIAMVKHLIRSSGGEPFGSGPDADCARSE